MTIKIFCPRKEEKTLLSGRRRGRTPARAAREKGKKERGKESDIFFF